MITKKEIFATNGKIFSVQFTKKDGTVRDMVCRLGVEKYLKGGELSYDIDQTPYVIVYDMQAKGYRTINTDTITAFKCGDKDA
jgi:hypothetical protein